MLFARYKTTICPSNGESFDEIAPLTVYTLNYEQEHESLLGVLDQALCTELEEENSPVVVAGWDELYRAALLLAEEVTNLPCTEDISNALSGFIAKNKNVDNFRIKITPIEEVELELPE